MKVFENLKTVVSLYSMVYGHWDGWK